MGRPTDLTVEIIERTIALTEVGLGIADAAEEQGVIPRTMWDWLRKGREAKDGLYADFAQGVERARARAKATVVGVVHKGICGYPETITTTRTEQSIATDANGDAILGSDDLPIVIEVSTVTVREAIRFDPRLGLTWLERRYPEEWGRSLRPDSTLPTPDEDGVIRHDDIAAAGVAAIVERRLRLAEEASG